MSDSNANPSSHRATFVPVTGKLADVSASNLSRLCIFLVEGNKVVAEAPIAASGTFQFYVSKHLANQPNAYAVLAPRGLDGHALTAHPELPRIRLESAARSDSGAVNVDFTPLKITEELMRNWWPWCPEYTVSGTLDTANGCPVPGAQVTVYSVTSGSSGLVKTPLATVTTAADGTFSATFNWCGPNCWPCWPIWWNCWPWWWERDILAVIDSVEQHIAARSVAGSAKLQPQNVVPLRQPDAADLLTGQAFARSSAEGALQPDAARTALIASKFSDPNIRERFPWWWWCCYNPNIVFSATQGANTILDEDPNTSTRWCFANGQSVALAANALAVGICQGTQTGQNAFIWTSVGEGGPYQVLVSDIQDGYANGTAGSDASNMAFAGTLNLCGAMGSNIAFYQVVAGLWGGDANPARGGTAPVTSQPLALTVQLVQTVFILRAGSPPTIETDQVVLGPCSFNSLNNLYMTPAQRQNAPASATLTAFPVLNPGDIFLGWSNPNLILTAPASALIGGAAAGGVDLTINAYDISGNPITLTPGTDVPLTLMIDTTGYSYALSLTGVFNSDNTSATAITTGKCPAYQITTSSGYVLFHLNVNDPNGHLYEYGITTQYGDGSLPALTTNPPSRGYAQSFLTFTQPLLPGQPYGIDPSYGVPNTTNPASPLQNSWTFVGGGDTVQILIMQSCCYDFQLWAGKRVTDGQTFACTSGNPAYQTVNITVAP